jgi:hypothetical protein
MRTEVLCPVRPSSLPERACIRVTVSYKRPDDEWSSEDHHWRTPEDLAACVCNCLDWCRMQRESKNWTWCAVSVSYEEV